MKAQALGDQINPYLYPPLDPNASSFHKKFPIGLGYLFQHPTMEESFTKHLPFSLLAKNLKKQSFEIQSLNHSGIF